jgi:flagellum-specific peptidoglycan hydrolase FlgJ
MASSSFLKNVTELGALVCVTRPATSARTTSVMKGRSNSSTLCSGTHCKCDNSSEALEKSSRSPVRCSASTMKKRASKRRGRPAGVIARNTNCKRSADGTLPVAEKLHQASGVSPGQSTLQPRIKPVSSHSSRIAATQSAAIRLRVQSLAKRSQHGDGIATESEISKSALSTVPPGKTNLFGIKAAWAPRFPIRILGFLKRFRSTITVAAFRIAVLSIVI